jgi:hypothetical protein
MCHAVASPFSAMYWHIGDTTTRLSSVSPRRVIGAKSEEATINLSYVVRIRRKSTIAGAELRDARNIA